MSREFGDIVRSRFAAEDFDGRLLAEDVVVELLELIRLAPSSYNLQPWKLRVVREAELKDRLAPACFDQPQIRSCSHLVIFLADTRLELLADELEALSRAEGVAESDIESMMQMIRGFTQHCQGEERANWARRQVYLALDHGLLGAEALGFAACPVEGFKPDDCAELLGLPEELLPTVLMPIGQASVAARPKIRFPLGSLLLD